jgi:DNA-binding NtrC family response regulator
MVDAAQPGRVLVVEDEPEVASSIVEVLDSEGHIASAVDTARGLRGHLEKRTPELILLDLGLPDADGLDLLEEIGQLDEVVSVVVITGSTDVATVVRAMQLGADNFLPKPIQMDDLLDAVQRALERHRFKRHAVVYRHRVGSSRAAKSFPGLVGSCPGVEEVRQLASRVAATDSSVLILGESGTGKGMVARGIHRLSSRASGPFVVVNCASIQPELLESELFGHEKGAFTGAVDRKPGLLEVADSGTLFLDEVSEMDLKAQSKLLTAVEEQAFRRVGGVRQIEVNVRLLAATHRDLEQRVRDGSFREDLFYRLNVFQLVMPPLRDRGDDVLELARHFIRELNPVLGRSVQTISSKAARALRGSHWPGNVRELRNVIERAMILCGGESLEVEHLPLNLADDAQAPSSRLESLAEMEARHIRKVLENQDLTVQKAADILGISRSTLYLKMKQYGIERAPSTV